MKTEVGVKDGEKSLGVHLFEAAGHGEDDW